MELFNLREKIIKIVTKNEQPLLINKINTKLNTTDTSLTRILYVATLYFNRILHVQIKAPRKTRKFYLQ